MEYVDDEDDEEEVVTCTACNKIIPSAKPVFWDREGGAICAHCSTGLVEVRYACYHEDGVHFDTCIASIPPDDVVTLCLETYPERTVAGITLSAVVSTRHYDSKNLPNFVELYEGTYRYVPGKRIAF